MYKNLRFKIILILVIFTVVLMVAVGTVLIVSTNNYYKTNFKSSMDKVLSSDSEITTSLIDALEGDDYAPKMGEILRSYTSTLGINEERNYYVLNMAGTILASSDAKSSIQITHNVLSAMSRKTDNRISVFESYVDYALYLSNNGHEAIVYIVDNQTTVSNLMEMFFQIILQSLFIGILISVILSFFLSQAITDPIENLTESAEKISKGEFSEEIKPSSDDEIGTLSSTFNYMKNALKSTLDQVSGERAKLETLFLYLNDAVLAFDSKGNLIHINKMAQTLFSSIDANSINFSKLVKAMDIDYKKLSEDFKEKKTSVMDDIMYEDKVFDITFAEFVYTYEGNNQNIGIMCVIHDNTGRYELDKSRREFVADVSHELRTPLTSIKGALETIKEYPDLDDESKESFINMAIEECNRMTRIVSDLLVLSRLDNNRTKWRISTFDVKEVISHICAMLDGEIKNNNLTLTTDIESDLQNISGDRDKIEQVLINIVTNSIKYTKSGGRIHIEANNSIDYVEISVTDSGVGIPEEDLPRIFERFYRVEKSRSTGAGGTGLGLAIAKEIVDAHGGKVDISSKVGVGTRITVILPIKSNLETMDGNETMI